MIGAVPVKREAEVAVDALVLERKMGSGVGCRLDR